MEVGPLDPTEAQTLARMIFRQSGAEPSSATDLPFGAARLFGVVRGLTVHYKRSLVLAVEQGTPLADYAEMLEQDGSLEDDDASELARRMVEHEVKQLDALQTTHGFAYRDFLGVYYPLVARTARFTIPELVEWFGDRFRSDQTVQAVDVVYRKGLETLARLSFCGKERRQNDQIAYSLPPNQRQVVKALSERGRDRRLRPSPLSIR